MAQRGIGIVGARALPSDFQEQVSEVVSYLIQGGYHIHSGGAIGADQYALRAVISQGASSQAVIYSAWRQISGFPRQVQPSIEHLRSHHGRIEWGMIGFQASRSQVTCGLLARNTRLVNESQGIVAFMYGESRGTLHTIQDAIMLRKKAVVFVCGGGASLPEVSKGRWVQLQCGIWKGAYLYKR